MPRGAMPLGLLFADWCRNVRRASVELTRTPKEIILQTRHVPTESSQSWKSLGIFTGILARIRGYPYYYIIAKYLLINNVARLDFLFLVCTLSYMDSATNTAVYILYLYIYIYIYVYASTIPHTYILLKFPTMSCQACTK